MRMRLAAAGVVVLLLCTLGLAYASKVVCVDREVGFWQYTNYCYSDITELWARRGLDRDAWVYTYPPHDRPVSEVFEYPPGTGVPIYVIARLTETRRSFFDVNALALGLAAMVTVWQLDTLLRRLGRPRVRVLGLVLAPTLVALGLQNWDLWALPFVVAGLHAAVARRPVLAGALFGLGAAIKWWPALLVVVLLTGPWASGRGWRRVAPALAGAGAWAAVQLPVAIVSPRGWWAAFAFHLERGPNADSLLAGIYRALDALGITVTSPTPGSIVTALLLAAGVAIVVRALARGRLAPPEAALILVALLLATSKVFSPQYVLWLLPLAVIARVSWTPVLAVESANLLTWFAIALYFGSDPKVLGLLNAAQVAALLRTATLLWVVVAAWRAPATRASSPPARPGASARLSSA